MSRVQYSQYQKELVLYLVNIYQPCDPASLMDILRGSEIAAFKGINENHLETILRDAEKKGLLLTTSTGRVHLTYLGLRFISEKRLAFPRDKNRLFYLKNVITGRRDRD